MKHLLLILFLFLAVFYGTAQETIVDTDNDGIADSVDDCPTLVGLKDNNGCPRIEPVICGIERGTFIEFDGNEKNVAKEISKILKEFPNISIAIEGYSIGSKVESVNMYNGYRSVRYFYKLLTEDFNIERDRLIKVTYGSKFKSNHKGKKVRGVGILILNQKETQNTIDTDKDGVANSVDNCPTISGPIENRGCPVNQEDKITCIDIISKVFYIKPDKVNLTIDELNQNRDIQKFVDIFREFDNLTFSIEGSSTLYDNDVENSQLGLKRAEFLRDYFLNEKGIKTTNFKVSNYNKEVLFPKVREHNNFVRISSVVE